MISEAFFTAYFWGLYGWFVVGAALIAIPAIVGLFKNPAFRIWKRLRK